jgi:hypothetical protein
VPSGCGKVLFFLFYGKALGFESFLLYFLVPTLVPPILSNYGCCN